MSIPHTGNLEAKIRGVHCQFDGDIWNSPDGDLAGRLNEATAAVPKTHFPIEEIAEAAILYAGLSDAAKIVSFTRDHWAEALPPGAID